MKWEPHVFVFHVTTARDKAVDFMNKQNKLTSTKTRRDHQRNIERKSYDTYIYNKVSLLSVSVRLDFALNSDTIE